MSSNNLHHSKISLKGESSSTPSIHLEDIPEDSLLYGYLQAYLAAQKQSDTFASIAKEDTDDIKSYEKLIKKK